jgi:phage shock protein E
LVVYVCCDASLHNTCRRPHSEGNDQRSKELVGYGKFLSRQLFSRNWDRLMSVPGKSKMRILKCFNGLPPAIVGVPISLFSPLIYMKTLIALLVVVSSAAAAEQIPNPLIDYPGFKTIVSDSAIERESRRLTEERFMEAMSAKDVIILDARSPAKYALRHIKGAINLPFTDFTAETLAQVIPSKTTTVLIYCNNNFEGSESAFPAKAPAASLNLSTYTSLRAYGYTNIFELGPLLDVRKTAIPFEGAEVN